MFIRDVYDEFIILPTASELGYLRMKAHCFGDRRVVVIIVTVLFAPFVGCSISNESKLDFIDKGELPYEAYMDSPVSQARQSLNQIIQYFQDPEAKILGPCLQARCLFCAYARLYVLEERAGDKDAAAVALIKARYWHLQNYETDNDWRARVPLSKFLSYLNEEYITEMIDKLDRGGKAGRGPKYQQYLLNTQGKKSKEYRP